MILTCPNCATRYSLPDVQLGPAGRKVKCAHCGHAWREMPPADSPLAAAPPAPAAEAPPAEDAPAPGAARRAAILREKKDRAKRQALQSATINTAVWAGLAAAVVLLLGLAVVFRETVVKLSPGTATAYAAIGLPVNRAGLLIEGVKASPGTLAGRKVLMVTGQLRNVAGAPVPPPAFRIDILDGVGHPLDHRVVLLQAASALKAGETRIFSLAIADPPQGAQDVDVTFSALAANPAAAPSAP
jgi:predicted Zn finger-like uncharacterized protein